MSRIVQYSRFGGPENLEIVEVEPPTAGEGQVRVQVVNAGLNPVDYKIFHGGPGASAYGVTLPSIPGNDFSGVIDQVGDGVTRWSVGDEVFGGARNFAVADFLILNEDGTLLPKPGELSFEAAGGLDIAGRTAWASVEALNLGEGDTVLVSAAAGGVGVLASQLALRKGATVIGTAGKGNQKFLKSIGVVPLVYGKGLLDRIREVAPDGITAVLDNHGAETIDIALELGVPLDRINTIAARGHKGAQGAGGQQATMEDLAEVARLIAEGELVSPIDSVFPIERVRDAYEKIEAHHLRGKIVLSFDRVTEEELPSEAVDDDIDEPEADETPAEEEPATDEAAQ